MMNWQADPEHYRISWSNWGHWEGYTSRAEAAEGFARVTGKQLTAEEAEIVISKYQDGTFGFRVHLYLR